MTDLVRLLEVIAAIYLVGPLFIGVGYILTIIGAAFSADPSKRVE